MNKDKLLKRVRKLFVDVDDALDYGDITEDDPATEILLSFLEDIDKMMMGVREPESEE
tara:strand:+ start:1715 stop:1888 length:174 start_codon:yes stop_codon:yes gene_type:complete